MELKQALRLSNFPRLALVGAGGKTTAMFRLARELIPPVVVCASTHLAVEQIRLADHHFILKNIEDTSFLQKSPLSGVNLLTGPVEGERTTGLTFDVFEWLNRYCDYHSNALLIEADGSRRLPLKAPADHEPAIPDFVDTVVVVAGLSGLGKPLTSEWVHRPERFASLSGLSLGQTITPQALAQVLSHPQGGLKGIPTKARRVALINQVDTPELEIIARGMVNQLLPEYHGVVIAALKNESYGEAVHSVHEPVAGIILAAGEARRFGQPKQLLPWKGKPLVWHAARKALEAGLAPVVVVSGAYTDELMPVLSDLPVMLVHNPNWSNGQGTSVASGVKALSSKVGAAVFLLADQPQIPVHLLHLLVKAHAETLSPIIAPRIDNQLANPVLFDRFVFNDLSNLSGSAGGRQLFSSYPITWVDWDDPSIFLDIDTFDDYEQLLSR